MRSYHFFIPISLALTILPCLGASVTGSVTIDEPAEPTVDQRPVLLTSQTEDGASEAIPQSDSAADIDEHLPVSHLRRASGEVTKSLEYRCGEKWGRCPSGTCCSSVVPYGPEEIRSCAVPGTVALTFDDGPTRYTNDLLDLLDKYEAPSTFFITGINNGKGQIDDPDLPWAALIERMLLSGHQVASHTWSHEDLSKVTAVQRADQIEKNEAALRNVMGSFPTYMRPPYSSCAKDSGCREHLGKLGYHIILYDIDTDDYKNDHPNLIQRSKDIFDQALSAASPASKSWLIIAHDAHEQTVHNLTEHMLKTMARLGYRPSTVGHRKKKGPKKAAPMQISVDGTCGKNYTCLGSSFGICCGNWSTCGNSTSHCGPGCQKEAGYCTIEAPPNGDAWDPNFPHKSGKSEADSDYRSVGTAAATSLFLAMMVAFWM
ncbi:Glycoside hydrolase/deacetylase beta/alpha-barrel [Penicillium chermesinum]|nr:Glycoside hydrolase/deacetylase beta/alpha-barrel [Penicillium chermesinum]